MIGWQFVSRILVLSATAAASTSVSAGELGPTSRSSISISVTIPTRLHAQVLGDAEPGAPFGRQAQSQRLCLITSNLDSTYSITLSSSSTTPATAAVVQPEVAPGIVLMWVDRERNSRRTEFTPGTTLSGVIGSGSGDCRTGSSEVGALSLSRTLRAANATSGPFTLIIAPN